MISKETAYIIIEDQVTCFDEQIASYKKTDYNETLTRRDFIDPFFKALGWDKDNSQGNAEAYREVIHEDKIKIGVAIKSKKSFHDEIVQLVTTMLQLQQQKQSATLPEQVQQLARRITYTDEKINKKVYALYGLSAAEVGVVEGR